MTTNKEPSDIGEGSTNPPYADTVAKYLKETNADREKVAADIAKAQIYFVVSTYIPYNVANPSLRRREL